MSNVSWTWTIVLGCSAAVAWLSCSKIESTVVFWDAVIKLFVYAVTLWICCTVLSNIYKFFNRQSKQVPGPEVPKERKQRLEELRRKSRKALQKETNDKAESYRERILVPREEVKKRKQDEELNLIMGHTFKGNGQQLGADGDVGDKSVRKDNLNEDARERRRLPPDVILHRPAPEPKPEIKRRVIVLPEEPDESDTDSINVTLHTPLDQRKSRRFHSSCTVQVVLDYMTTLGFSEAHYTLSTSYPRKPLTDSTEESLKELGFPKRTLLYVEEKD